MYEESSYNVENNFTSLYYNMKSDFRNYLTGEDFTGSESGDVIWGQEYAFTQPIYYKVALGRLPIPRGL